MIVRESLSISWLLLPFPDPSTQESDQQCVPQRHHVGRPGHTDRSQNGNKKGLKDEKMRSGRKRGEGARPPAGVFHLQSHSRQHPSREPLKITGNAVSSS